MKRTLILAALFAGILGLHGVANALPVTFEGKLYYPGVVAYDGWHYSDAKVESREVGVSRVKDEAGSLYSLIDLDWRIGSPIDTFPPFDLIWKTQADLNISDSQAGAIRNMMGFYNSGAQDKIQSAALHMAIYEVLSDNAWSVSSGQFKVVGVGSWGGDSGWDFILDQAGTATFLTAINVMLASASDGALGGNIILKYAQLADRYGLMPVLSYAVTPIPGAIWLLGSGLAGLAAWRRKAAR